MTSGTKVYIVSATAQPPGYLHMDDIQQQEAGLSQDPCQVCPEWKKSENFIFIFARKLLYSSNSEECGVDCGKVHNIFLKVSSLITSAVKGTSSLNIYERIDQKKESEINF